MKLVCLILFLLHGDMTDVKGRVIRCDTKQRPWGIWTELAIHKVNIGQGCVLFITLMCQCENNKGGRYITKKCMHAVYHSRKWI